MWTPEKEKDNKQIVTGGEMWIYWDNSMRQHCWVNLRNIHFPAKARCYSTRQCFVFGETRETVVYHEGKPKRPECDVRQHKVVLLHDNARPHL